MSRSVLETARRLASRGRHTGVISLLESRLPLFRDSHRYYYLLGASCLRTGDVGGATTYLRRAEQLDHRDLDTKLCLAALHLRRGEGEKALALYLEVLDEKPSDRTAKRALAFLRRADSSEKASSLASAGGLEGFLPPIRGLPTWIVPLSIGALALVAAGLLLPLAVAAIGELASKSGPRADVAAVVLSDKERKNPVASAGGSRYILTEKDALAAFDRAKARFQEYRDNAALVDINRILDSNASASLKEKARTLLAFVAAPDWRNLRDIPTFGEVAADPGLYRDCSVIWRGRAANIHRSGTERGFDFLAGYADKQTLDGIVPVSVSEAGLSIPAEAPFEILARVRVDSGRFSLSLLALHELREATPD